MSAHDDLWDVGMGAIRTLEVDRGILASSKEEIYGCVFGRDSLITSLLLLRVYEKTKDAYLLALVRKVLVNLAKLQGRERNLESGEEPGKIIHEFRPENHEHLTEHLEHPWFLYPDGIMRNYDSVDATPLFLIALERYYRLAHDESILELLSENLDEALAWVLASTEAHQDGLVGYAFHPERSFGGLRVQSWMDSAESVFFEDRDETPAYTLAPVEVQAYAYRALSVWHLLYREQDPARAESLLGCARALRERFYEHFMLPNGTPAFAVDGQGRMLVSARSSMGHLLWMGARDNGTYYSLLAPEDVGRVVERLMKSDLFVPGAGIRTLSSDSRKFDPHSYHNGSIWPHDTALIALGMRDAGFEKEAARVREALLAAYAHFATPLELFAHDEKLMPYAGSNGQGSCQVQAWSAAGLLALLSEEA
ncbi:MAG TPA: amylo-alpha-1,6-glucosidase [Candidatus Paceibacterota bacterium]